MSITLPVSRSVMRLLKKRGALPHVSETERIALNAGDVWIERELFSGRPDLNALLDPPEPRLTPAETEFLDGPVRRLCGLVTDWDIWRRRDLPPEAWELIREERFFGLIIPQEYGGHGFSPHAVSEILKRLATRSSALSTTVSVPNSLGPGKLLLHHGTEEQKRHYLPRLARAEDIPCFALTEPEAGSDAASLRSSGEVFQGSDGKLYLRLNWNKRWITLSLISTVMGLAFRLRDPSNLLGMGVEPGITCALVPTSSPGITLNRRHDPLGVPFFNSPTQGKDVVIPVEKIIGGAAGAGRGWMMLMEALADGRGIAIPAGAVGQTLLAARATGAFATIRRQFGRPIGDFEAVAGVLARIAGNFYLMDSARRYTNGALNRGLRPPLVTAILKHYASELARQVANDAMDVHGGTGITLGPRNLVAHNYIGAPIAITVEGANIMTRSLIIFGQGVIRAHPWAFKVIQSMERGDEKEFDRALRGHARHFIRNLFRAFALTLTGALFVRVPEKGRVGRYLQKLSWSSACFALLSDLALLGYGGSLKTREKISSRLAEILGWLYLASASVNRFRNDGRNESDAPYLEWAMETSLQKIQSRLLGSLDNLRFPGSRLLCAPLKLLLTFNPVGRAPRDALELELARAMRTPGAVRDRILGDVYLPSRSTGMTDEPLLLLETAHRKVQECEPARKKLRAAAKRGLFGKGMLDEAELADLAFKLGVLSETEYARLLQAEAMRWEAMQVDDFSLEEMRGAAEPASRTWPRQGQN